jgi:CrcB protein
MIDTHPGMSRFFWICVGGAAGTAARYLISGWALAILGTGFPWGTLVVNVLGSFFIGGVMQVGLTTQILSPTLRLALTTGVMGGFTTYSAFNYESLKFLQDGAWLLGLANILVMVVACLAAGTAGLWIARLALGH